MSEQLKEHGQTKMDHVKEFEHEVEELVEKVIEEGVRDIKAAPGTARKFWHNLGPGLTTGASDDDPSGIATYSQTGAQYGLGFVWLSLFTFPLMSTVQEMCARIGIVTGQGLAANIRRYYSRPVLYTCTLLLLAANIFNIGANLGAMAKAVQLISPTVPFGLLVVFFGIAGLLLQVFTTYESYARYLKYLALILLSYVATAFFVEINWSSVFASLVIPSFDFSRDQILLVCAILGTTISPYLFFWQTSQEVEEKILRRDKANKAREKELKDQELLEAAVHEVKMEVLSDPDVAEEHGIETDQIIETKEDMDAGIKKMRVDVWLGMFISNLVMFFIITVCAVTLNKAGITTINDAADAAEALRPFAGDFAFLLFAVGIIGTGLLAIPVLAGSAAYAVSESLGWKFGLYRKLKEAYAFYGVIAVATVIGIILNFIGLDPIKALIYSAVGNGLVAPVILFLILRMSSNESIMGEYKNSTLSKTIGWITVLLMIGAAIGTLWVLFN